MKEMPFTAEQRVVIERGETIYKELCFSCHGTDGKGASEPIRLPDTSGLTQEDIYALNRRVEWRRD